MPLLAAILLPAACQVIMDVWILCKQCCTCSPTLIWCKWQCGFLSQAAGVPTEYKQINGTSHGFLHFSLPQTVEAMEMSAAALRAAFALA